MLNGFLKTNCLIFGIALLSACDSGSRSGEQANSSNTTVQPFEVGASTLAIGQPQLDWSICESDAALECATLLVPLDYSNRNSETTPVELARFSRADRSEIRRTLLVNPGGPGGSGIDYLSNLNDFGELSSQMREEFDFVSFDPRGVGRSAALICDVRLLSDQNRYPSTTNQIIANQTISDDFTNLCTQLRGEMLQQVGSVNVVLDMNQIRIAMGLTEFDFVGFSYGSRLAALHLQLFPESSGRFVIDGSLAPGPSLIESVRGGLPAGQANISSLANLCVGVRITCSPEDFEVALLQRAEELGQESNSDESFLFFTIVALAAQQPQLHGVLIGALDSYLETNNAFLLELVGAFLGISDTINVQTAALGTANISVLCADDSERLTNDELIELNSQFNGLSDLLAELFVSRVGLCGSWPEAINPTPTISTNQAPVSLVIGGPTDAQTPIEFSEQMSQAIGGQFLRSEHMGHTSVFTGKNSCTNGVAEAFLLNGELPTFSTCSPSSMAVASDWHDKFMSANKIGRY